MRNFIISATELFASANEEQKPGKTDPANFILSRSSKSLKDLIKTSEPWTVHMNACLTAMDFGMKRLCRF